MRVGIEDINLYGGRAFLDVSRLVEARQLDAVRFQNLLLRQKTVALPFEDPVTFAVNAAKPVVNRLPEETKKRIELLIVATESGLDFGKAMSTYVQHHLGLSRNCRTFEIKHACYAGTAALQMAVGFVLSDVSPGAKALIITTDAARPIPHTYAEPSQGAAAIAMLIGDEPVVLEIEKGAAGYYGYEVMDSCRPTPDIETGDADLSLLSYLECLENCVGAYCAKLGQIDIARHFDYLAFHTPFGGLAKGAHRTLMRKWKHLPPSAIEEDFARRMAASLTYCQRVGNIYSGTLFLALCGVLECGRFDSTKRIGLFSYGSGCCSEFFSGLANAQSRSRVLSHGLNSQLDARYELEMPEYEALLEDHGWLIFGVKNVEINGTNHRRIRASHFEGQGLLVLRGIRNYHREYAWS